MSKFDTLYLDLCERILNEGNEEMGRNGYTLRVPNNTWEIDLEEEFPILTVKKVYWKMAVMEMQWIYQAQSIDVRWLQDRGIKIWNKFMVGKDGVYVNPDTGEKRFIGVEWAYTIGPSYAYIIKHGGLPSCPNQVDYALYQIVNNPTDRRILICMWQPPFFGKAVLPPCVYEVQFLVFDGKLYAIVQQRSCDMFLGVPFNVPQYAALTCMFAHVTGLKPGKLFYRMGDCHIYEEHIDVVKEMLLRRDQALPAPELWINPEIKNFYDFDNTKEMKDFKLLNYKDLGVLKGEVKA